MAKTNTSASSIKKLMTKYDRELRKLSKIYQAEADRHSKELPEGIITQPSDASIVFQIYQGVAVDFMSAAIHLTARQDKLVELKQSLRNIKAKQRRNAKKA